MNYFHQLERYFTSLGICDPEHQQLTKYIFLHPLVANRQVSFPTRYNVDKVPVFTKEPILLNEPFTEEMYFSIVLTEKNILTHWTKTKLKETVMAICSIYIPYNPKTLLFDLALKYTINPYPEVDASTTLVRKQLTEFKEKSPTLDSLRLEQVRKVTRISDLDGRAMSLRELGKVYIKNGEQSYVRWTELNELFLDYYMKNRWEFSDQTKSIWKDF